MLRKIFFVAIFVLMTFFMMGATVQYWSARNLKAETAFYVGSKNVFNFLDGLVNNQTVTGSIGDSTITLQKMKKSALDFIGSGGNVVNNPDEITLTTLAGNTIGQKVFNTLTDLQATRADSNGMVAIVKERTSGSGVGGGDYVWYSSGYSANGVTEFAGSSGYWVRRSWANGDKTINPEWAGAIPNDMLSDSAAFQLCANLVESDSALMQIPKGIFLTTKTTFNTPVTHSAMVRGTGRGNTIVQAFRQSQPVFIFKTTSGRAAMDYIEDMTILGISPSTDLDTALVQFTGGVNNVSFKNIHTRYAKYHFLGSLIEGLTFENVRTEDGGYFYHFTSTVTNVQWKNCYRSRADSTEIYIAGTGKGNIMQGGEGGTDSRIGIEINDQISMAINGGNFEQCDSTFFIVGISSQLSLKNTRVLNTPGQNTFGAIVKNSGELQLQSVEFQQFENDTIIWKQLPSAYVNEWRASPVLRTKTYESGSWFYPNLFPSRLANAIPAASATYRGSFFNVIRRTGIAELDQIIFYQQTNDTTYRQNYITDGDFRYSTTSGAGSRDPNARRYAWRQSGTTSGGDSTYMSFTVGTVGFSNYYSLTATALMDTAFFKGDVGVRIVKFTASTGVGLALVTHTGAGSGIAFAVSFVADVVGKPEDY